MSAARRAMTSALAWPTVESRAPSWRLMLLSPYASWSMRVSSPTPARARHSAAQLPTPPRPTTHTWDRASFSRAAGPKSISFRKNRSVIDISSFTERTDPEQFSGSVLIFDMTYPTSFMPPLLLSAVTLLVSSFCHSVCAALRRAFSQAYCQYWVSP